MDKKAKKATYMREWRAANRERARELSRAGTAKYKTTHRDEWESQQKRHNDKVRSAILAFFGGKCVRCGFDDPRALQMDHINGGGHKLRQQGKHSSLGARWAVVRDTPEIARATFQLLCANCNVIKRAEKHEYGARTLAAAARRRTA